VSQLVKHERIETTVAKVQFFFFLGSFTILVIFRGLRICFDEFI
jgi:hypothetical protein